MPCGKIQKQSIHLIIVVKPSRFFWSPRKRPNYRNHLLTSLRNHMWINCVAIVLQKIEVNQFWTVNSCRRFVHWVTPDCIQDNWIISMQYFTIIYIRRNWNWNAYYSPSTKLPEGDVFSSTSLSVCLQGDPITHNPSPPLCTGL